MAVPPPQGGDFFPSAGMVIFDASRASKQKGDCAMDTVVAYFRQLSCLPKGTPEMMFTCIRATGGSEFLRKLIAETYRKGSPHYLEWVVQPFLYDFFQGFTSQSAGNGVLPPNLLRDVDGDQQVNLTHPLVMEHFGWKNDGETDEAYGRRYTMSPPTRALLCGPSFCRQFLRKVSISTADLGATIAADISRRWSFVCCGTFAAGLDGQGL